MGLVEYNNILTNEEKLELLDYVNELAEMVESAATELYLIKNWENTGNAKFNQWVESANKYLGSHNDPQFFEAHYGYAVEEYVNLHIDSGTPAVPNGYKVKTQVTHGGTRPDIVIFKGNTEIAWLDITSERSVRHIYGKDCSWKTARPFTAELSYPDFDRSQISTGGGGVAARALANSIVRRDAVFQRTLMAYLASQMNYVIGILIHGKNISQKEVAECIEERFELRFNVNYKHPIIKSMLLLYKECNDASHKQDAIDFLSNFYKETKRNQSAAMFYIARSFEKLNPMVRF